jgi:hypothetical protein
MPSSLYSPYDDDEYPHLYESDSSSGDHDSDEEEFDSLDDSAIHLSSPQTENSDAPSSSFSTHISNSDDTEEFSDKILDIIRYIEQQGLTMASFLDAFFWGNKACTDNRRIIWRRTQFTHSPRLTGILERLYSPPPSSKGSRPEGASKVMKKFGVNVVLEAMDEELESTATLFLPGKLSKEELNNINLRQLYENMKEKAPICWHVLMDMCRIRKGPKTPVMPRPGPQVFVYR